MGQGRNGPNHLPPRARLPFSSAPTGGMVRAMTRSRTIAAARTAPFRAVVVVNLRGLLLLTLR